MRSRRHRDSIKYAGTAGIIAVDIHHEKLRGTPRDYAILAGEKLITAHREYVIKSRATGDPVAFKLIHRRDLWRVLGPTEARRFWRFGRATRA